MLEELPIVSEVNDLFDEEIQSSEFP